jgi:hypothetical protein
MPVKYVRNLYTNQWSMIIFTRFQVISDLTLADIPFLLAIELNVVMVL